MLTYIHELIDKSQGSISISDFMNAVLYHEKYGYYTSKLPLGKDGDFTTAPEISQLFGEVIAVWIMHTWEKLGKPSKFSLVELGPGKGTLIHDIIRVTKKYSSFFNSMLIHLVEISPTLRKIQKEKLKSLDVNWHKNIDNLPEQPTIFLANEFFDALPIDQFVYHDEGWYENMVTKQDDGSLLVSCQCVTLESRKKESWTPVSATQMTNGKFFNGAVVEICSVGVEMLKKLEKKIYNNKGAALIVDYGYVYPAYKSTLQSIKQHKYANFLENVGNSDITALVNFQALRDSLKHVDCEILTQREFLYLFGIKERTQALMKSASDEQKNRIFSEFLRLTENMGTLFKAMLLI
ncbi:class I SAM-dependent methyltransferase [Wolbachia endosymbiont (group A) of Philonthus cognatus]|uniref:class I SAM-dependent methyltransferase n=1 Tax=Wolbachia endosymbiont (group A) of Philonthus cognatus TaxID=2954046 RepID=UPI00222ECBA4|nr:SAM-dependent methyltransferase [Wolbachia endosymbiont (group A) of Philonthus cognatus]